MGPRDEPSIDRLAAFGAAADAPPPTRTFSYLGTTLVVPSEVAPITSVSRLLGEAVMAEVRAGDRVLDVETGCGVNAILAASKSADVEAVDGSSGAVEAARANALRNGVADRINVHHSDLFSQVDGVFDLIIFDPPSPWLATTNEADDRILAEFFRDATAHLTDEGRILVLFGTSGDVAYLRRLVERAGLSAEVVAQQDLVKDGWQVEYFTFRLTR